MRLINVNTLRLEEFFDQDIPPYAILSHRWGKEEVTFQDYVQRGGNARRAAGRRKKAGFAKVTGLCNMAKSTSIKYAWIDTCCIDKTSSAELSEAINSMFAWYRQSTVCYAYLSDVTASDPGQYDTALRRSKWFTRGWTLQELIAPEHLKFYDKNWQLMGTRGSKHRVIQDITGIDADFLLRRRDPVTESPVAERFSWASRRKTTRTEDMAYCLLGLLDVNMPLLYGEGHKAFRRLQEEFMRTHLDLTLLTWGFMVSPQVYMGFSNCQSAAIGCLANTVTQFQMWNQKAVFVDDPEEHHTATNAGLLLPAEAREVARAGSLRFGYIPLDNIRNAQGRGSILAVPLVWSDTGSSSTKARRADGNGPFWVPSPTSQTTTSKSRTYLVSPPDVQVIPPADLRRTPTKHQYYVNYHSDMRNFPLDFGPLSQHGYYVADFYPPAAFRPMSLMSRGVEECALLRFSHAKKGDLFLFQRPSSPTLGGHVLSLGTAPESCTTWEHLLKPDYGRISFQRPKKSFSWFSTVKLKDLKRHSRVVVDIREGLDSHGNSDVKTHVSLKVVGADLPVGVSGNTAKQPDSWSISADKGC